MLALSRTILYMRRKANSPNRRLSTRFAALFFALVALAVTTSASASADGFEPNNSVAAANGPLLEGGSYEGKIDNPGDTDFFYFYVTASHGADVTIELNNLGGGSALADVDLTLMDSTATPRSSISFLRPGEGAKVELALPAQKYYVEISSREEIGDGYRFTMSDGGGIGTYNVISGRCGADTRSAKSLRKKLSEATVKLQRALNQVRRSRYLSLGTRTAARDRYKKAKSVLATTREKRTKVERQRGLWCSIAP
jgi:hypothetical protein